MIKPFLAAGVFVTLAAATFGAAAPRPPAPVVIGPRDTTLERPAYTFRAPRATGFMSVEFGYASAWVANYDRGTLTEVPDRPGAPP